MLKRVIFAVTAVFFIIGMAGVSFAAEKGNERRGKLIYRNVYKSCYKRGEIESKSPVLHPDMKTMSQWERVFEKESVCMHHKMLMGPQSDMDLIAGAIKKIYDNAEELT